MQHLYHFAAKSFLVIACLVLLIGTGEVSAQTTSFTFKGQLPFKAQLSDVNSVRESLYEMQFKLRDAALDGEQVGPTLTFDGIAPNPDAVIVTNGVYTVHLDFGASAFPGADRYLEVAVKFPGEMTFTPLSPLHHLTSTPYAIRSLSAAAADTATNALQLGLVAAEQYVQTIDPRLSDSRPPTPGSSNYIQNKTSPQSLSNFNISGNGTAGGELSGNTINAATQYNIGGNRVLHARENNLFAGIGAGQSNSIGNFNAFVGANAGVNNTSGRENTFVGASAGAINTVGVGNTFVGASAGINNTDGSYNSFFGYVAGENNTEGTFNSFFGLLAGKFNTTGFSNSFFGMVAGRDNTAGFSNSFFGTEAGLGNTTGADNSFFGRSAGTSNRTGSHITLVGSNANVGTSSLDHATAIGAGSIVTSSNTVVLGRAADSVRVPGGLTVTTLAVAGLAHLCRDLFNQIANCSSSLRYKTNIAPFSFGMNLVSRLRPISFDWKTGGQRDVGFGAEEVAAINPLFVAYNSNGQVEGVKYDRLSVAFVNAFKEQQAQIEQQRDQISKQQNQLDALRKLVCIDHPSAAACK